MRKAGDGYCAVVMGVGDGAFIRSLIPLYRRVSAICLPGETPVQIAAPHFFQFVVAGPENAGQVISTGFAHHRRIAELEATDFYGTHPIAIAEDVRLAFSRRFYELLAQRPVSQGDDVIDGLQGAFHIAMHAHLLAPAPTPDELERLSCPAIAIAPGPSLKDHLPALRALQSKCLLICADSALDGLLREGIAPHIVTPLERTRNVVDESFAAARYPSTVFAGSPAVHQDIAAKFTRHILIPGSDVLFTWAGCKREQLFFYGQSTGVLAATLATRMTTGPVYLVGHDLAFNERASHWDGVHAGVQIGENVERHAVMGNSGEMVASQYWWTVFCNELSDLARETGQIVNVNAVTGIGAKILHAKGATLPDPLSLEPFRMPLWPEPNHERAERFASLLRDLPGDVRRVLLKLSSSRLAPGDIDFSKLCDSENAEMLGYITRSILAQFGTQNLNGQSAQEATNDCADAVRNALRSCLPIFERMANAPICQRAACAAA
jgi:uncharacterized Rossmann fold enzyme